MMPTFEWSGFGDKKPVKDADRRALMLEFERWLADMRKKPHFNRIDIKAKLELTQRTILFADAEGAAKGERMRREKLKVEDGSQKPDSEGDGE
jgi:hypothetical protein